jgi:hypothetical protein
LLSLREDLAGRRFIRLNFNPELSTVQRTPDWPVLFWNLLEWRAAETPGLQQSNIRIGSEMIVKTGGAEVDVISPDGSIRHLARSTDQVALETPQAGLYSVVLNGVTNVFAVNCLAADESNLEPCAAGEWGQWENQGEARFEQSPLAWIFALCASGILALHLGLLASGKGGS